MMRKNLMLIFGGVSFEHEISLRSAYGIYSALMKLDKYNVYPSFIDKITGIWYLLDSVPDVPELIKRDNSAIISLIPGCGIFVNDKALEIDVVFPIVHGRTGEDGAIQGFLKMMDIPCVGAGILGSAISINKYFCKLLLKSFDIPLVPFIGFRKYDYFLDKEGIKKDIKQSLNYPVIVKPAMLGSSIGISIAYNDTQIEKCIEDAFTYDLTVVVEKFMKVREIECSVIGNEQIKIFTPGEIVVQDFVFYDYDAKYSTVPGNSVVFNIPARLDMKYLLDIKEYAFLTYKCLELRGMARIDFLIEKDTDLIYVNEINTIPGFTDISMFSKMCEHDGLDYESLVDKLVSLAFQSYAKRKERIDFKRLEN
ncbi:D-alanine--D-alanine ligase [Borrelia nietonii YOR]|uniref:D-alanine--D-alanine ligase n=1 Tax=Borrelia nietonii YOR TaxID=1293576 RepID=A0ABN4C807_9SPIR|nr:MULTISPECIES: D-alanine--D-alanine ligase [Borrelia]AHH03163.1 D-alanine--D-alanine ligase [Borrelia nietonii YOR]AHH13697.1 D-alanine--D-alanine ligase [Borrelia hermsii MTW]UPA08925.1 D-alanine--D-alanine ligase [Borrelia nietonii YOR]